MQTAAELYRRYRIMPSLQMHQLRVAAVAKLVCENFQEPVRTSEVVLAGLFHDMGNIIKSDLQYFPEFVEPEGLDHWQKVKEEFISKYSTDHHAANVSIAREIGLPEPSVKLIDSIGFSQLLDVVADDSRERKIMQYADVRVGPHGVLTLEERLQEGRERYTKTRTERVYYGRSDEFERLRQAAEELERQVAAKARIKPEDINDATIEPIAEELRNYLV